MHITQCKKILRRQGRLGQKNRYDVEVKENHIVTILVYLL